MVGEEEVAARALRGVGEQVPAGRRIGVLSRSGARIEDSTTQVEW